MDGISSNDAVAKDACVSPSLTESGGRVRRFFGLSSSKRLRKPWQFRQVYDGGNKQVGRHMVLWHLSGDAVGNHKYDKTDEQTGRLGVVASKKTGNAPVRARCKRRLRELYRLHQHELATPHDIVFVARRGLDTAQHDVILAEFLRLLREAKLLS